MGTTKDRAHERHLVEITKAQKAFPGWGVYSWGKMIERICDPTRNQIVAARSFEKVADRIVAGISGVPPKPRYRLVYYYTMEGHEGDQEPILEEAIAGREEDECVTEEELETATKIARKRLKSF